MRNIPLAFLVVFVLTGCAGQVMIVSTPTPDVSACTIENVTRAQEDMDKVMDVWLDAEDIAGSTARLSLPGPIAELQAIRRDAREIQVPACLEPAHTELISAMDASIDAFLAFSSQKSDASVTRLFKEAAEHVANFSDQVTLIRACVPDCP